MPVRLRPRFLSADVLSVARNGAFLTGTQWSEALLRAVFVLVIARVLGPEDYGLWNYAIGAYSLGVMCSVFGTDVLLARQVGAAPQQSAPFIATTLGLRLLLVLASGLVLALYAFLVADDDLLQIALLLTLPALVGRGLALWARPVFTGIERAGTVLRITGSLRLVEVAVGMVLLFATRNVLLVIGWHAATWVIEAGVSYHWVRKLTGLTGPDLSRAAMKPVLREATPIGLAAMAVAAMTVAPVLLAVPLGFGLTDVGQLGIALQLASLATMGAQGFLNAALPVLSRRNASEGKADPRYGWLVLLATAILFGVMCLVAWLIGERLMVLLLGDDFARAGALLWLALLVAGASVLPNGFWQLLVVRRRQRAGVVPSWAGLGLSLALLAFSDLHQTVEGLLWATLAGWTLRAALLIVVSQRQDEPGQKPT